MACKQKLGSGSLLSAPVGSAFRAAKRQLEGMANIRNRPLPWWIIAPISFFLLNTRTTNATRPAFPPPSHVYYNGNNLHYDPSFSLFHLGSFFGILFRLAISPLPVGPPSQTPNPCSRLRTPQHARTSRYTGNKFFFLSLRLPLHPSTIPWRNSLKTDSFCPPLLWREPKVPKAIGKCKLLPSPTYPSFKKRYLTHSFPVIMHWANCKTVHFWIMLKDEGRAKSFLAHLAKRYKLNCIFLDLTD